MRNQSRFITAAGVLVAALAASALACGGGGLLGTPEPTRPAPVSWQQDTTATYISPPIVVDGVVVYEGPSADLAQDVFGRDAATGRLLWTYDLGTYSTLDTPLSTDGGLIFLIHDLETESSLSTGTVVALDAKNGAERWSVALGDTSTDYLNSDYPYAAGGRVFFESGYGHAAQAHTLSAVEAATGDALWDYPLTDAGLLVQPIVVDGLLIGAQSNFAAGEARVSHVFALDAATGEEQWSFELKDDLLRERFAAGDGRVYYFATDGTAVALEAASGQQLWAVPLGDTDPNDPHIMGVYAGGQFFVGTGGGTIYALDGATGEERWQFATQQPFAANLAAGSGLVFAGTLEGRLFAIEANNGAERWQLRSALHSAFAVSDYYPPIDIAPGVQDGVLYLALDDKLIALQVGP